MAVVVTCPNCGARGKAHDDKIGKRVKCAKCGGAVPVRADAEAVEDRLGLDEGPGRWDDPTETSGDWRAARARAAATSGRKRQIVFAAVAVLGVVGMLVAGEMYASQREAMEALEAEAEQGHADAIYELATRYDTGSGRRQDPQKAWELYVDAARRGSPDAAFTVAQRFELGHGVEIKEDVALHWYHEASVGGHPQALQRYRQIGESGNLDAQAGLGRIYLEGKGVPKDAAEAVRWLTMAAEGGRLAAQYELAQMFAEGQDVARDSPKALEWYTRAAEQGHAEAAFAAGEMHEQGEGTRPSLAAALPWYTKSAEGGYAQAQLHLGTLYYDGRGVAEDKEAALEWFLKAARQEHPEAQFRAGGMYFNGEGTEREFGRALKEFGRAGDRGHARAQYAVGVMLFNRLGELPKDRLDPYWQPRHAGEYWIDLAFETGGWPRVPVYTAPDVIYITDPYRDDDTFVFDPGLGLILRDKKLRNQYPPPGARP